MPRAHALEYILLPPVLGDVRLLLQEVCPEVGLRPEEVLLYLRTLRRQYAAGCPQARRLRRRARGPRLHPGLLRGDVGARGVQAGPRRLHPGLLRCDVGASRGQVRPAGRQVRCIGLQPRLRRLEAPLLRLGGEVVHLELATGVVCRRLSHADAVLGGREVERSLRAAVHDPCLGKGGACPRPRPGDGGVLLPHGEREVLLNGGRSGLREAR